MALAAQKRSPGEGTEAGLLEIPASGRRFRALELLVKQSRPARSSAVPGVVREEGIAEEDSLVENLQRAPLHPRPRSHGPNGEARGRRRPAVAAEEGRRRIYRKGPHATAGPILLGRSPMTDSAADLARRLGCEAEAVCRHYLSNGRRQGRYWLVGDARNTLGRSMYVRLTGPPCGKGAAGK